jgi:hypothetical protein
VPSRKELHGRLKLAEYRVLLTIQDYKKMPGIGILASDTLMSKSDVRRSIASLKRQGILHDEEPVKQLPRCLLCGKPIFKPGQEHVCPHCEMESNA